MSYISVSRRGSEDRPAVARYRPRQPRHQLRLLVAALLAGVGGVTWAESPQQAVQLALSHDSTISAAAAGATAAGLQAESVARSALPLLTLGASYQYNSATADISLPVGGQVQTVSLVQQNTIDTSAGVRWTPFAGFSRQAKIELQRLSSLLALNSVDAARVRVALATVTAFRQAQAAQLQIETLDSGRQRTQLQLDQATSLEKQGMAKQVDVLSLTIARLDYDQKLISARATLEDALSHLESLTGKRVTVEHPPTELPNILLPPLNLEALQQIKALSIQRDELAASRKLAEAAYYPAISVNGALHYGLPGANPIKNEWMLYGTAGISLTWSYDWGGTSLAVRAAETNLTRLSRSDSATRDELSLAFTKAVRDWHAMKAEAAVIASQLELSRSRMEIVKSQYDQGLASTNDFNDANLGLTQAELRYRTQLLALELAANQIDALSGEPIDQWSINQ